MIKRAIIILLFFCGAAFAYEGLDYFTYFGTTAETYTVTWAADPNALINHVRLFNHEKNIYVDLGSTTGSQWDIHLPKTGHYSAEVRSCNDNGCSEWSKSIDPDRAKVNDNPRAWWIYGYVAPPGPLEFKTFLE